MTLYKPGRARELHPLTDRSQRPPKSKGEYRILDGTTKKPVYIGVTKNLDRRMHEHMKTGKINESNSIFAYKTADGRASQQRLNDHERAKIEKHDPELNQRAGGAGRPYKSGKKR
jgi:hypothetical protein